MSGEGFASGHPFMRELTTAPQFGAALFNSSAITNFSTPAVYISCECISWDLSHSGS